jgi:hypothetical protein
MAPIDNWKDAILNKKLVAFKRLVTEENVNTYEGVDTPATFLAKNSFPDATPFLEHLLVTGADLTLYDKQGITAGTSIGKCAANASNQIMYQLLVALNNGTSPLDPGKVWYRRIPGISYVSSFTRIGSGAVSGLGTVAYGGLWGLGQVATIASTGKTMGGKFVFSGGRRTRRSKSRKMRRTRNKKSKNK